MIGGGKGLGCGNFSFTKNFVCFAGGIGIGFRGYGCKCWVSGSFSSNCCN